MATRMGASMTRGTASKAYGTHRSVMPSGYIRIWEPEHDLAMADGYVMEHRKVVYDAGHEIPDGFHVHHINGDKADNRLENLEVIPAPDHVRRHLDERGEITNQFGTWPIGDAEGSRIRRNASMVAARQQRALRPHEAPHGTIGGYLNWKCRCDECRQAYSEYRKAKRREAKERAA